MRAVWLALWATLFVAVAPIWPDRDAGTPTDSPERPRRMFSAFSFAAAFVYFYFLVGLPARLKLTDSSDPCHGLQARQRPRMCGPHEYYPEQFFGYFDLVLLAALVLWVGRLGLTYWSVAFELARSRRLHIGHWRWLAMRSAFDGTCYWGFLISATISTGMLLSAVDLATREGHEGAVPVLMLFWQELGHDAWRFAGFAGPAILILVAVLPCQRAIDRLAKPSWMATVSQCFE